MTDLSSILRLSIGIVAACLLATACNGPDPHQGVLLEIDRMEGTRPVEDRQKLGGEDVSLAEIYKDGEMGLRIVHDQKDLEHQDTIRLADLHALMIANRNQAAADDEWHIHMLVVTEDADDPYTLGIMFDFGDDDDNDVPREAFAVFESAHEGLQGGVVPEVLLTSAHELAHVFNLHHSDWEGRDFERDATVESYSTTDSVRWSLSAQSVKHLTKHDSRLVEPGPGGLNFADISQEHLDSHQPTPPGAYNVIDASGTAVLRSRKIEKHDAVRSRLPEEATPVAHSSHPVKLRIEAPQEVYTVGEPVIVSVVLANEGDEPVDVISQLQPEYRFLSVAIKPPKGADFLAYRSPVLRDARRVRSRTIEPGGQISADAKLFFGADGWTFETPGQYVIRASYPAGTRISGDRVQSDDLTIIVESPRTESTGSAKKLLLDQEQKGLGKEQGLFLYMEGGDHLTYGAGKLKELVETAPSSDQAAAARLALGTAALNPTYDAQRRVRPEANLDEAIEYFQGLPDVENIPAETIKRFGEQLSDELEKADRMDEALLYRGQIADKLETPQDP